MRAIYHLFPFCKYMFVPGKSPVKVKLKILSFFILRKLYIGYMGWRHVSLHVVTMMWTNLDPLLLFCFLAIFVLCLSSFAVFMKQWVDHYLWLVLRALLANAAVVDSDEVGSLAVYRRCNNWLGTVLWGMSALTGQFYPASTFTRMCLLYKYDFWSRK